MSWYFDPNRVTQAAAFMVSRSDSASMPYLKLLKLLYFADRESIREKGYPITGDQPYAMDYGPVLTRVYDYIKCKPRKGAHVWAKHFRTSGYDIELSVDPGTGDLSRYDRRILQRVYDEHKDVDGFDMSQLSHDYPEWKETYRGEGSSTPLSIETILKAVGIEESHIQEIIEQSGEERRYFEYFENVGGELGDSAGKLLSA